MSDDAPRPDIEGCLAAIARVLEVDLRAADPRLPLGELMDSLEVMEALLIADEHGFTMELDEDRVMITVADLFSVMGVDR